MRRGLIAAVSVIALMLAGGIVWNANASPLNLPSLPNYSPVETVGCASALIRAGLDVMRVSKQLGHSNPNITLGTFHEFEEADTGAADAIGKVLG
jgi:hypothetical protein